MGITRERSVDQSRPSPRWLPLVAVASAVVAIDQATKEAVRAAFDPGEGMHTFGSYSIQHFQNAGVAGGGLRGSALPLAVLALLCVVLLYEFLAQRSPMRLTLLLGFGLLIGGGLGNLVDRWRLGFVTDFIRNGERAFNVADIAIFLGGALVMVALAGSLARLLVQMAERQPTRSGG